MVESFQRYKSILDPADTLFAANFLLGYFGSVDDAPHLMRRQKVEDLKRKNESLEYATEAEKASRVQGLIGDLYDLDTTIEGL